ncbi:MAG: DUF748 domain-containing protein [Proteobacteria bacterium]|nr:DUF748 domain-containing protein [Pseudomonadota bacterium]
MMLRLPSRKRLALVLAGLVAAYLLFGWLALPPILQSQAEKFIAAKTGHRGIRLDGLEVTLVMLPDGRLNWSALIEALKSKEETPEAPLPRLDIQRFSLAGAWLDFTDQRISPAFATRIEPMDLELTDLSTQPDDQGQFKLSARTAFGARVAWQGKASLEPLATTGSLSIEDVDISRLAAYFGEGLAIAPPKGIAGLSADYRLGYAKGRLEVNLEHLAAKFTGLRFQGKADSGPTLFLDSVEAKQGRFDLARHNIALDALNVSSGRLELRPESGQQGRDANPAALELGSLALADARIDLEARQATLGRIALKDGRVRATRDAQGRIDLIEALQGFLPPARSKQETPREPATNSAGAPAAAGWHYRLEKLELSGYSAALRDEAVTPAAELGLEDIALGLEAISEDPKAAMPLRASFRSRDGGDFKAEGKVVRAGPTADIRMKLTELSLKPAQPYLSAVAKLKLAEGRLSTAGRASYNAKGAGYRGSFALRDLRLNEEATNNLFMSWKSLGTGAFEVTPSALNIGELGVDGLDTQLIIDKDKTVSIKRILRQAAAAPTPAGQPPAAAEQVRPFLVNIERLRVSRGEMDFADYSLSLPFATRIHRLQGVITGISSRPDAPALVELDGQVDDYGMARAFGQLDLFNPTDFMDLKVVFRNIEMTRLTPYSGTFAGRRIDSGKLSLDLEYKIKQRQLQGENRVVMDQLTLGERVDSPEARNLPLDLAIAILKDADGRIELGLPVSGSLDDPQFSYGGIVWKAIVNVLTRIATAPFRALGALFGSDEKFESIVFEAGDAKLKPPEREKLVRLAGALAKRPGLSLAVHGVYAESDRAALQDSQLRRSVLERTGQHLEGDSDPGPISTRQPKVQSALETLFTDRYGSAELAALKQGYRQANPGQLEESTTGKVMSRLSGLFKEKRVLSGQELTQLKGADFHAVLFDRLRNDLAVSDEHLLALAKSRGEAAVKVLKTAGAPEERLALLAAEKMESGGREVPVKLVLTSVAAAPAN